jgi:hypothetical protein
MENHRLFQLPRQIQLVQEPKVLLQPVLLLSVTVDKYKSLSRCFCFVIKALSFFMGYQVTYCKHDEVDWYPVVFIIQQSNKRNKVYFPIGGSPVMGLAEPFFRHHRETACMAVGHIDVAHGSVRERHPVPCVAKPVYGTDDFVSLDAAVFGKIHMQFGETVANTGACSYRIIRGVEYQ